jgi:predicted alpha-1,2-mannosidase
MVSVSPHNDLSAPSGYVAGRPFLYGFGHVHLSGAGCPDLGNILLMPTVGAIQTDPEQWKSAYDSESASPGYYSVRLKKGGILAEMTATVRAGMSRYSFPSGEGGANILLDPGSRLTGDPATLKTGFLSRVRIVSNREVEGYGQSGDFCTPYAGNKQTVYFVARFSKTAVREGTWKDGRLSGSREQTGEKVGAFFSFSAAGLEPIVVKVGISYVSVKNARENLEKEMPGWDFQAVRQDAQESWEKELSRIQVEGGTDDQRKIFYTALYHSLLQPFVFSDANGDYRAMDGKGVLQAEDYTRYDGFSLWDTYRCLHPFLGLVYPERELDMIKSLVEMGKEAGLLPRWELAGHDTRVMVGCPALPVILDGYRQGLKDFDLDSAYAAMARSLDPKDNKTYGGLRSLLQYGYIPKDDDSGDVLWGSVSTSLEYSYDFWCLAQMAKDLSVKGGYDQYIHLSGVYRNLFDSQTGFLRPRNRDGSWMTPFHPLAECCDQSWPGSGGPGYVEGNAWQYLFDVPQDMDGLRMLLGGDEEFVGRLEECFEGGHYDPGNEPDLSWPYLFDEVPGQAWRTQKEVRRIMARSYGTGPSGLPGNDDSGSLSSWYVFSAMGFYPACPGSNRYELGSPLFSRVDLHLDTMVYPGGRLTLKTIDNSPENDYIQSVLVNGMEYKGNDLSHENLVYGNTVVVRMGSQPKTQEPF